MRQTVFIVDDDDALRVSLAQLLEISGFYVESYESGTAFLAACTEDARGCVILDMAMPGLKGHEVQAELNKRGIPLPVIFLSGYSHMLDAVQALRNGAVAFLEKPVQSEVLLQRVHMALALDAHREGSDSERDKIKRQFVNLNPCEKEVLRLIVGGLSHKEIAGRLDLSHHSVETHLTRVMHKMGADNLAELVRISGHCLS